MNFDPQKNYYDILWVSKDASVDDIKKAFRKLAVKHHPDKKWGDQEKFQEINEAHQVLSDEKTKQQYDAYRSWWFGGFGWWGWFGWWGFGGFDIGDIVGDMFGGGFWWQSRSQRGRDLQYDMTITFEESYTGTEKIIQYRRLVLQEWLTAETCSHCQWRGSVTQQVRTPLGVMQTQVACPHCQWSGNIYKKDGEEVTDAFTKKEKKLTVKIPAAIKDDVMIKFTGMGDAGRSWDGDLYVKIHIQRSDTYTRKNNDLHVTTSVSLFDLVLGGTQKVPHPEGEITIKIPKGTQPNSLIKVGGKGFGEKGIFAQRGDMFIKPHISIPKKLSKKQEKLRKELQGTK